jgi:hypothetical protein
VQNTDNPTTESFGEASLSNEAGTVFALSLIIVDVSAFRMLGRQYSIINAAAPY